jgi:hypothetical protein
MIDILTALHDANPQRGNRRCKVQSILDEIPDETAGKDALVAAIADAASYPAQRLTLTFSALGSPVSDGTIANHRGKRCACYR